MAKPVPKTFINFDNTEIAFANKSNAGPSIPF